jgi:hypothetical protein
MTQLRTNRRLWFVVSICLFIALGFIDPLAGLTQKSEHNLWAEFGAMANGNSFVIRNMLPGVIAYSLLNAFAAALLGWVVQALVIAARTWCCPGPNAMVFSANSDRPA